MSVQNTLNHTSQTGQTWHSPIPSVGIPETRIDSQNVAPAVSDSEQGRLGIAKYGEGTSQSMALPPIARPVITVASDVKSAPQTSLENTTALIRATALMTAPLPDKAPSSVGVGSGSTTASQKTQQRDPKDPRAVMARGFTVDESVDSSKLERLEAAFYKTTTDFRKPSEVLLVSLDQKKIQVHPITLDEKGVADLLKASEKPNGKWALEVLRNQATRGVYKSSLEAIRKVGENYTAPQANTKEVREIMSLAKKRLEEQSKPKTPSK